MPYPYQPAPMPEDASPLEVNRDRQFLAALISGRISPALRLAAFRIDAPVRATRPLTPAPEMPGTGRLRTRA